MLSCSFIYPFQELKLKASYGKLQMWMMLNAEYVNMNMVRKLEYSGYCIFKSIIGFVLMRIVLFGF